MKETWKNIKKIKSSLGKDIPCWEVDRDTVEKWNFKDFRSLKYDNKRKGWVLEFKVIDNSIDEDYFDDDDNFVFIKNLFFDEEKAGNKALHWLGVKWVRGKR